MSDRQPSRGQARRNGIWSPGNVIVPNRPPTTEILVGHDGHTVMIVLKIGEQTMPMRLTNDQAVEHATNVLVTVQDLRAAQCQAESRRTEDPGYRLRPDIETTTATNGTATPPGSTPATDGGACDR